MIRFILTMLLVITNSAWVIHINYANEQSIKRKLETMDARFKSIHEITETCKPNEKFLFLTINMEEYRNSYIETFPLVMCSERETSHTVDNWK